MIKMNKEHSKNKRAQINQVFIFITAILVIGLIVVVATKSMGGLINEKCTVDLITFKDDVTSEISSNNDYGSRNEIRLSIPCDYTTMCLIDTSALTDDVKSYQVGVTMAQSDLPGAFIIGNSIKSQIKTNIFLISENGEETIEVGYVEQLQLGFTPNDPLSNILCVDATAGYFKLRTEGLGRYTKLKLP